MTAAICIVSSLQWATRLMRANIAMAFIGVVGTAAAATSASANDGHVEYRVEHPGVDVEPALVSVNPECVIDAVEGPTIYRTLTVDALCLAGSKVLSPGIASLRLLIYGITKAAQMTARAESDRNPTAASAGPVERTIQDFPLTGYTAFSAYMAAEGFSFERADGTRYFATSEFAVTKPDADLPEELTCQSIWAKAKGASEFSLELSKCTAFLQLGGLKVFVIIDLTEAVTSEALRTALRASSASITARVP